MVNNIFYTSRAVCVSHDIDMDTLVDMVEWRIVKPMGKTPNKWLFSSIDNKRIELAAKYHNNLHLEPAAIMVAVSLSEDIEELRNPM